MSTAVWRPSPHVAHPVLGIEHYHADGQHADIVTHLPEWPGPDVVEAVPLAQIQLQPRSIVRALTADFVDHSRADRCRCGGLRDSGFSQPQAVAQAGAGGEAAPVTNFPQ